jgi:hypothetical protein
MIGFRHAAAAAVFTLALTATGAARAGDAEDQAAMARLLGGLGQTYNTTKSPTVVTIPYHGKTIGDFRIIAAFQNNLAVIFTNPMKKGSFVETTDSFRKMARMNHEFDTVKIGVDDDGDFFVRADMSLTYATPAEFREVVKQVAASTDEAYQSMAPYRTGK